MRLFSTGLSLVLFVLLPPLAMDDSRLPGLWSRASLIPLDVPTSANLYPSTGNRSPKQILVSHVRYPKDLLNVIKISLN